MNKRINELAGQAMAELTIAGWNLQTSPFNLFTNKFAELIVRECADYVQFYYKDHMCEVIAHDMKQHFGVEE